jgi:hypothetical protein
LGILICFDKKETWANGIRHNSKYAQFIIHSGEDKLELLCEYKANKFRKVKVQSMEELIIRLQNYINEVEGGVEIIPLPKRNKQGQEVKADIETMTLIEAARLVVAQWQYKLIRECKEQTEGQPRRYEVKDNEGNKTNRWTVLDGTTAGVMVQVFDFIKGKSEQTDDEETANKAKRLLEKWQVMPLAGAIDFTWRMAGK